MTNLAKRFWPDTVASRAILILVAALLAFHLLGYWAYRVGVENLATAGQDRSLAERIVSIKRAIASLPQAPERGGPPQGAGAGAGGGILPRRLRR